MNGVDTDVWGPRSPIGLTKNMNQSMDKTSDAKLIPKPDMKKIYHQAEKISDDVAFGMPSSVVLKLPATRPREETKQETDLETWK